MNSESDRKEAELHVDTQFKFMRSRIDLLSKYGLEMEDFSWLESFVIDIKAVPLYHLYRMAFENPVDLEIGDTQQLRTFLQGLVFGYAAGLKAEYPEINHDEDIQAPEPKDD